MLTSKMQNKVWTLEQACLLETAQHWGRQLTPDLAVQCIWGQLWIVLVHTDPMSLHCPQIINEHQTRSTPSLGRCNSKAPKVQLSYLATKSIYFRCRSTVQGRDAYVGAVLSDGGAEGLNNAGVDVELVVPGHAGFPRHPGRDDHDVRPLQSLPELVVPDEPLHLQENSKPRTIRRDPIQPS